ncbi:MAG: hypothetical protein VYE68_12470 [Acidobacteriota bacterium]|nr:hypothetical protein [Acidobacteriota bacterium]
MKARLCRFLSLSTFAILVLPAISQAQCEPDGDIQFVCGAISPEDLAQVPDTPWVLVANMVDDGYLSAADTRDHSLVRVFPTTTIPTRARHDTDTYAGCPGLTTEQFRAHGVSLRPGDGGMHTLHVVRHGEREAIEVFEVDANQTPPQLTWIGCAVAPEGLGLNSVVGLPDGGFAATSPATGDVWEWHTDNGWERVPGSEDIGPNGLEISADGQWFLVAGYRAQSVIRLSRGRIPVAADTIEVGFNIDNVHWAPDGTLLAAGHTAPTPTGVRDCIRGENCEGVMSYVARVDVDAGTSEQIFSYPSNDLVILGTAAIEVGDELWVGQVAEGTRIARAPLR